MSDYQVLTDTVDQQIFACYFRCSVKNANTNSAQTFRAVTITCFLTPQRRSLIAHEMLWFAKTRTFIAANIS